MPLQQKQQSDRRPPAQQRPKDEHDPKLIDLARVSRVTKGGRHFSFRAVVVAGDQKGKVGVGVAKGKDVAQAMEKATSQAKKNFITVPLFEETIPHEVEAKSGSSVVLLKPQQKGRGLVAGGPVRIIAEKAGIKNISAKFISRTHNKLNNAMAVIEALRKLRARKPRQVSEKKEEDQTI
ncbi:MAG: 30S ribosomal protein S5 [bacterium]|nr:30S ribosomal protein S5 [bacterium]